MDVSVVEGTLLLAFGLGLLHALDADHVMAVSSLGAGRPGLRQCLRFCSRWALGHGMALCLIAMAVFGFSAAIPERLSELAESLVGLVLIGLGGWALWDLSRRRLRLGFHHHPPDINHAHWQLDDPQRPGRHDHSALLVGMLHGIAGSAPLLVLIPLSRFGSVTDAMAYVLLFSIGVILSMLLFGGVMGGCYRYLERFGAAVINGVRFVVAGGAMVFGGHLLVGYF